jgi:hypothetical protein
VRRLVLETAIGPVLPLSDGKDREARWDSAAATGGVTQDPPCSRAARQGPATSEWRSAAEPNVQPGWLVQPLPRRGAWKGLRHRPHSAADRSCHIATGMNASRACAIGCPALSPSAVVQRAGPIRLVASTLSHRHAPDPRQPRQPAGSPDRPVGRPAAADPTNAQAFGAANPPRTSADALTQAEVERPCPPRFKWPAVTPRQGIPGGAYSSIHARREGWRRHVVSQPQTVDGESMAHLAAPQPCRRLLTTLVTMAWSPWQ